MIYGSKSLINIPVEVGLRYGIQNFKNEWVS